MYKLFFAWQSQVKDTHNFIRKHLRLAVKELEKQGLDITIIESPTQEEAGSPDITGAIWEQIYDSEVFVGDVSFVENGTSNSNVMYEVGIADALLGANRVILLADSNTTINEIAFDINHKRISPIKDSEFFYKELASWIQAALENAEQSIFVKKSIAENLAEELGTMFNYFCNLSGVKWIPDMHKIEEATVEKIMTEKEYDFIVLNVTLQKVIESMEEKLQRYQFLLSKRLAWKYIRVIERLKEYQFLCECIHHDHISIIPESRVQSNLYDSNTFKLNGSFDVKYLKGNVFFSKNALILCGTNGFSALDKRMLCDMGDNGKIQQAEIEGGGLTGVVMRKARVNENRIPDISQCVANCLNAIVECINSFGFAIVDAGKDGADIGVFSLEIR